MTVSYAVEDGVAVLTLDDPDSLNAVTDQDVLAIGAGAAAAGSDPSVRALVITGAGRAFCAGAHVSKMGELIEADALTIRAGLADWQRSLLALERLEKPVVAGINGVCVAAGAALALACDIRIASEAAMIAFPSVQVGLVTDLGCSRRLPRIVGIGWAKHCLLTGCRLEARTAERNGLVTMMLPADGFRDALLGFVREELTSRSVVAQGVMKRLVDHNADAGLEAALESELMAQSLLYGSADVREGHRAILERRPPLFE